jgi:hypothetical protein
MVLGIYSLDRPFLLAPPTPDVRAAPANPRR